MTTEPRSSHIKTIFESFQEQTKIEEIYKSLQSKYKAKTTELLQGIYFLLLNDILQPKEKHLAIIIYLQLCEDIKNETYKRMLWNLEKNREDDNIRMLIYEMLVLKSFQKV